MLEACDERFWPLLPSQQRFLRVAPTLERFCKWTHRALRRPQATPRERTQRCYEDFLDPLCAETGVWNDYTEGYYRRGDETYEEAQLAQFDAILDYADCGPGVRVLDIGCGNGNLVARARKRGCHVVGATISRSQVEACNARGLDVRYSSFEKTPEIFVDKAPFDVILLNGSTEHFITAQESAEGREEEARAGLYKVLARLLEPGGKVFHTCIHQRVPLDPQEALRSPLLHQPGDRHFFSSILVGFYSGWYPRDGAWDQAAVAHGFRKTTQKDATEHYYRTSKTWTRRLSTYVRKRRLFATRFAWNLFWKDPEFFFYAAMYWVYEPWTWQFRGGMKSPMSQTWSMYEKEEENS